jgi:peptidoglycan hydrolase-like protein with peptidoglycan-binding domain
MKDLLEDSGTRLGPRSILALVSTAALSMAITYNAFFGQEFSSSRPKFVASRETASGASTRVDVIASDRNQKTIVLRYDPQVEEIQRRLLTTGDYKGMVDGVAGTRTRLAIEAYQRTAGLKVNGEVTTELIEHIRFTQQVAEASQFTGSVEPVDDGEENSSQVRQVQTGLAELGYVPGEITGDLTDATRLAIMQFQKDRGLARNGEVTDALLNEIAKMSGDTTLATP